MRYGAVTRAALWVQETAQQEDNAVLGLVGEAGEIADYFKKLKYHPFPNLTIQDLRAEIGDTLFYLALLNECIFGDSLLNVAKDNIEKLKKRWPDRYADVVTEDLTL